jgi:site-specific recombinase XerD
MLTLYKRHSAECAEARRKEGTGKTLSQLRADRGYRRCSCPIHAEGTLRIDGFIRKATGELKWPKAEELKKKWEDAGTLEVALPAPTSPDPQEAPTVKHVVEQFMNDRKACGLRPATLKKYRQFADLLQEFCNDSGVVYITQFGIDQARTFRESWAGSPVTNLKRLERMKAFFSWVTAQRWIEINPAERLRAPLTDDAPADPISQEDLADLIGAIERMPTRESEKSMSHDRLLAMILLLRNTGLRISDVVRFSTERLKGNSALLHMAKTGNPVWLPLPEFLVAKLKALPLYEGKYYFASGSCKRDTATGNARRSLRKLSMLARIRMPNPHRFRDTLAIDLLQQGVPIEDVQQILGHEDVNTTLRHYGNWVKERQDRLTRSMEKIWETA